jgi:SAM-dependent methyltransferase
VSEPNTARSGQQKGKYQARSAGQNAEGGHWFEPLADFMGPAYLRYSFTKGTEQEVDFLVGALGLGAGDRVLDVGCGPGRHAHALARRGMRVVGVDIAEAFTALARDGAPEAIGSGRSAFARADARRLPVEPGAFDAAISLCQGGFGLLDADDHLVMDAMVEAVKPTGRLAVSAFSAYFAVRHLETTDAFDAASGVNQERTEIRNETGETRAVDLWTSCFTPRELRLMAAGSGLAVDHLWSVTPGAYAAHPPDLDHPEWLLIGTKPAW